MAVSFDFHENKTWEKQWLQRKKVRAFPPIRMTNFPYRINGFLALQNMHQLKIVALRRVQKKTSKWKATLKSEIALNKVYLMSLDIVETLVAAHGQSHSVTLVHLPSSSSFDSYVWLIKTLRSQSVGSNDSIIFCISLSLKHFGWPIDLKTTCNYTAHHFPFLFVFVAIV